MTNDNDDGVTITNIIHIQVFSDEFETDGRSFQDGQDSKWTALDKNDCEYQKIIKLER